MIDINASEVAAIHSLEERRFGERGVAIFWRTNHPATGPTLVLLGALSFALPFGVAVLLALNHRLGLSMTWLSLAALVVLTGSTLGAALREGKCLLCFERRLDTLWTANASGTLAVPFGAVRGLEVRSPTRLDARLQLELVTAQHRYPLARGLRPEEIAWLLARLNAVLKGDTHASR